MYSGSTVFHTEESTKSKPWMTRSFDQIDGKETNKLTHEFKTLDSKIVRLK